MTYEGLGPPRKAENVEDFTVITAAMIEAAALPPEGNSHRHLLMRVRQATGYEMADVAHVMMELVSEGVLERSINLKRRDTALTLLGVTVRQHLHRIADNLDESG